MNIQTFTAQYWHAILKQGILCSFYSHLILHCSPDMEVNGQTLVSFLAPISEEKTLNPHPLFSHIRLVLHKETFHVQKILLVQWPEEEGYTIISNRVPIQRESKRNQPEIDDSLEDRTKKKLKIT